MADEAVTPPQPNPYGESLSSEANKPAEDVLREAMNRAAAQTAETKRKPGRPPGAKNKPKEPTAVVPPADRQKISVPRSAPKMVDVPVDEATLAQKAAAKQARAEELTHKIVEGLNENLMDVFMMLGMPAEMLYKPGMIPQHAPSNTPYTELGNKLAVPHNTAKAWGRFLAEIEATDLGQKMTGASQGTTMVPLIITGVLALATGVQYAKGVNEVMGQMQQLMAAKAAYEQSINNNKDGDNA